MSGVGLRVGSEAVKDLNVCGTAARYLVSLIPREDGRFGFEPHFEYIGDSLEEIPEGGDCVVLDVLPIVNSAVAKWYTDGRFRGSWGAEPSPFQDDKGRPRVFVNIPALLFVGNHDITIPLDVVINRVNYREMAKRDPNRKLITSKG